MDSHVHVFLTDEFHVAHRARQQFGVKTLARLALFGPLLPVLWAEPTRFFCKTEAQLDFPVLFSSFSLLGLSATVLRVSGMALSFSWGFENFTPFDGMGCFAAKAGIDCVPVDGASDSGWVGITRIAADRQSQGMQSCVDYC